MSSLEGDIIKVTSSGNCVLTDMNNSVNVKAYVTFDSLL